MKMYKVIGYEFSKQGDYRRLPAVRVAKNLGEVAEYIGELRPRIDTAPHGGQIEVLRIDFRQPTQEEWLRLFESDSPGGRDSMLFYLDTLMTNVQLIDCVTIRRGGTTNGNTQ